MLFKKSALILSSLIFIIPSLSQAGEASIKPLSGDEIKQMLSDKTITTIPTVTLNGSIVSNTFTGYFGKDGKLMGKFNQKPENDAPQNDTGTWKINSNTLCFKWDHWDANKEKCVSMYKLNNGILVINKENGFETVILEKGMQSGNKL